MAFNMNKNDLRGWNGYIAGDGIFYRINRRKAYACSEDGYISLFSKDALYDKVIKQLRDRGINNVPNISVSELLLNVLGYIHFEVFDDNINITYPNYLENDHDVSEEQLETLLLLREVNNKETKEHFCRLRK